MDVAYTLSHSDSNAPDTGNSSLGVVQFDSFDIEKDRGPDPNVVKHRVVANATWDIPVGRGRPHGADLPGWANELFGGWTVSTIVQARSGPNLTPFFTGFYTTSPWNTGRALDGLGVSASRGDRTRSAIRIPAVRAKQFFNPAAYTMPAPGQLGNTKKGSLRGPGTWVANFGFYKDIVTRNSFRLQFTTLLDNAFNHPQFFVSAIDAPDFLNLTDALVNGVPDNGSTGVLGAGAVQNVEGFSPGRVIRLGLRATFLAPAPGAGASPPACRAHGSHEVDRDRKVPVNSFQGAHVTSLHSDPPSPLHAQFGRRIHGIDAIIATPKPRAFRRRWTCLLIYAAGDR